MKDHPEVAGELKKDPNLINDPNYLAKHPELNNYLAQHPGIRREAEAHPESFARAAEANNKYNHGDRVVPAQGYASSLRKFTWPKLGCPFDPCAGKSIYIVLPALEWTFFCAQTCVFIFSSNCYHSQIPTPTC